jgi:hypothetical protein
MVCDMPKAKCYMFDMPRSMNKDRLFQFYAAVGTIKDGYTYDDRYSFKESVFDCPVIWIFMNKAPNMNLLSPDRWNLWQVSDSQELNKYDGPRPTSPHITCATDAGTVCTVFNAFEFSVRIFALYITNSRGAVQTARPTSPHVTCATDAGTVCTVFNAPPRLTATSLLQRGPLLRYRFLISQEGTEMFGTWDP